MNHGGFFVVLENYMGNLSSIHKISKQRKKICLCIRIVITQPKRSGKNVYKQLKSDAQKAIKNYLREETKSRVINLLGFDI